MPYDDKIASIPLTRRENELHALMLTDAPDVRAMACEMNLTDKTLKLYSCRLYKKLGAASRYELMGREIARLRAVAGAHYAF